MQSISRVAKNPFCRRFSTPQTLPRQKRRKHMVKEKIHGLVVAQVQYRMARSLRALAPFPDRRQRYNSKTPMPHDVSVDCRCCCRWLLRRIPSAVVVLSLLTRYLHVGCFRVNFSIWIAVNIMSLPSRILRAAISRPNMLARKSALATNSSRVFLSTTGGSMLTQMAKENPYKDVVRYEHKNRKWNLQHVDYYSEALAIGLLENGLQPGDVVLSWLPAHFSESVSCIVCIRRTRDIP